MVPRRSPPRHDQFEFHLERAEMLFDAKRYKDARAEYMNAIANDPENAWAFSRLGVCCSVLGLSGEAIEHGTKAISLMPDWAEVHYQLAWIFNCLEKKREAELAARDALACDPQCSKAIVLMAWTFLDRNRLSEAQAAIEQAIALQPIDVEVLNVQGVAFLKLGKLDEAQDTLARALSLDPDNSTAHANLGFVYLHRGNWKKAEDHLRCALRLEPQFEYAHLGINEVLRGKHPAFRWITKYRLWLDRQPKGLVVAMFFIVLIIAHAVALFTKYSV